MFVPELQFCGAALAGWPGQAVKGLCGMPGVWECPHWLSVTPWSGQL